jgi:hypothetical protein
VAEALEGPSNKKQVAKVHVHFAYFIVLLLWNEPFVLRIPGTDHHLAALIDGANILARFAYAAAERDFLAFLFLRALIPHHAECV